MECLKVNGTGLARCVRVKGDALGEQSLELLQTKRTDAKPAWLEAQPFTFCITLEALELLSQIVQSDLAV